MDARRTAKSEKDSLMHQRDPSGQKVLPAKSSGGRPASTEQKAA